VEASRRADAVWLRLEAGAARELDVLQLLDRGELPVDEAGIGEWPEMLSWLQFRRIRRQEEQMDMLRHAEPQARMPPARSKTSTICFAGLAPT
jgi:hypothetical protein